MGRGPPARPDQEKTTWLTMIPIPVACGGNCSCQSEQSSQVYLTPAEYLTRLEQYLADLKAEIVSVEAELASLRQTA